MATATMVSVAEYQAGSYRPDVELLKGQLDERTLGEYDHSNLQGALVALLRNRKRDSNIRVLPEQRIRCRIPDICVMSREQNTEHALTSPPLICVEILSRDDALRSMQSRVDDYLAFGVQNIWIPDVSPRQSYVCSQRGVGESATGIPEGVGTPARIVPADLFADLN